MECYSDINTGGLTNVKTDDSWVDKVFWSSGSMTIKTSSKHTNDWRKVVAVVG